MKEKKSHKVTDSIFRILIGILVILFLIGGYHVATYLYEAKKNKETNDELKDIFYDPPISSSVPADEPSGPDGSEPSSQPTPELTEEERVAAGMMALNELNEDVFGWLKIESIEVDYPVLQGENNDEYLRHDLYHEYQEAGCLFVDFRIDLENGRNLVIHGHNMDNGTMFGQLKKYLSQEFYENEPSFYLYTEDTIYRCDIFTAYRVTTAELYAQHDFASDAEYQEYLDKYAAKSAIYTGISPTASDRIVTLSTCDYVLDRTAGRLAVQAVMVPVASLPDVSTVPAE